MKTYGRLGHGRRRRAAARGRSRDAARLAKHVADRLAPYAEHDGRDPLAAAIAYPEDSDFGRRLRYLAAMISKPLGIRVAHVEADGDFDTHDNQQELTRLLADVSAVPRRLPGRPRGARRRRPRADVRVVASSAAGPRQNDSRHRPRRRRPRLGAGRPRARAGSTATTPTSAGSTATTTSRSRSTSGASTRACWSSTWAPTPRP